MAVSATARGVCRLSFRATARSPRAVNPSGDPRARRHLARATAQLRDYFIGRRHTFTLALDPAGTPFQHAVWRATSTIPYGETRSYRWVAGRINRPRAARRIIRERSRTSTNH
jgi:O6-methylguanine-DNA--protein-cysteine methyltransferase